MKILFIAGSARSGSTIFANVLGQFDGFVSVGEVRFLWERAIRARTCGCGTAVTGCELWGPVLERGTLAHGVDPNDVVRWDRETMRLKHLPRLLRVSRRAVSGDDPLGRYLDVLERTYAAIAELTGASVIVDSTKRPTNAAALRLLPDVDASIVHLVRDPRAVAFSRRRAKPVDDPRAPSEGLSSRSVMDSVLHWTASNAAAAAARRRAGKRGRLLRYERFADRPRVCARATVSSTNESPTGDPFVDDRTIALEPTHTVSGNPDRFRVGSISIEPDDRWVREMTVRDRLAVTVLTLPGIAAYGYPLLTKRSG